jgi:hypothetical protein
VKFDFSFFISNEKWKIENGCSFSIFHFTFAMKNEINGMYTDREGSVVWHTPLMITRCNSRRRRLVHGVDRLHARDRIFGGKKRS